MKIIFQIILLSYASLLLTGCSGNSSTLTLRADEGQLDSGSTITIIGTAGEMLIPDSPSHPGGKKFKISSVELPNSFEKTVAVNGRIQKFHLDEMHWDLSFIVAAGKFICSNCATIKLPTEWHVVSQ